MVSNQSNREIYVLEIVFGPNSSGKIPCPLQRQKNVDITFLDCSTAPSLQRIHFRV